MFNKDQENEILEKAAWTVLDSIFQPESLPMQEVSNIYLSGVKIGTNTETILQQVRMYIINVLEGQFSPETADLLEDLMEYANFAEFAEYIVEFV